MNTTLTLRSLLVLAALTISAASSARAEEATTATPAAAAVKSEFIGIWKVQDSKSRAFYITLTEDGKAASSWTSAEDQRRNKTGTWVAEQGKVVVTWDNGWREVIEASAESFVKKAFSPRAQLTDEPTNTSPASKVDAIPAS